MQQLKGTDTNSIKQQEHRYTVSDKNIKNCKSSIKKKRKDKHLNTLTSLREQMSSKYKRLNDIAQEHKTVQVVDNRATQDTFQSLKEIKICNFYVPFLRL